MAAWDEGVDTSPRMGQFRAAHRRGLEPFGNWAVRLGLWLVLHVRGGLQPLLRPDPQRHRQL